jgi:Arc/MetJ-type ribon-helix-helix transcriptional regulator
MPDTEKITINMPAVDLGKIDLLVQEGIYTNRTDFIRTAIRSQIDKHNFEIQQSVERHSFVIGVLVYDRRDLEKLVSKGEKLKITIIGMLFLNNDVTPELALQAIESVNVRGIFNASDEVKAALSSITH